ncbi:MAG TPA: hypothetical protein VHE35_27460, partial [Kofleriaceae bacterium]|nr:hypothetical protein [Kofleriaceae bacterium]
MSGEQRLDDALAALAGARPRLDEFTRARIGARIDAEATRLEADREAERERARTRGPRVRRWPIAVVLAAG